MITCYEKLVDLNLVENAELDLLKTWNYDMKNYKRK